MFLHTRSKETFREGEEIGNGRLKAKGENVRRREGDIGGKKEWRGAGGE